MNRGKPLGYGWIRGAGGHMGAIHEDDDNPKFVYYLDAKDNWRRFRLDSVRFFTKP